MSSGLPRIKSGTFRAGDSHSPCCVQGWWHSLHGGRVDVRIRDMRLVVVTWGDARDKFWVKSLEKGLARSSLALAVPLQKTLLGRSVSRWVGLKHPLSSLPGSPCKLFREGQGGWLG